VSDPTLDPFARLGAWLDDATRASVVEPSAMTLATATPDGRPSARVVLLRGLGPDGLVFYTNYESRKGSELDANPRAAAVFYWGSLARQVRVEGGVTRLGSADSDRYFAQRPRGHQLSAWASRQSSVVPSREFLENRVREAERNFAAGDVTRPPYWGGFRLVPERFEFWEGRPDRMHDRIVYLREGAGWRTERLSP
jgi:pyridoxamine 5'-phosphate oxidase